jgi:hypothetical protein
MMIRPGKANCLTFGSPVPVHNEPTSVINFSTIRNIAQVLSGYKVFAGGESKFL